MALILSDWQGDKWQKLIDADIDTRLKVLGISLENELRAELSEKGNIDKKNPSEPGEPPAKVTGRLAGSVTHTIDKTETGWKLRVGSPVLYGKFLELSTKFMAERPWLRPILRKNLERIKALFRKR